METQKSFLRSLANDLIETGQTVKSESFDLNKLTWAAIASIPAKERAGTAISKEDWEAFVTDYVDVMPGATGKSKEKVALAASIFAKKLLPVKTNLDALATLSQQLDIWYEASKMQEQMTDVYTFLREKIDSYSKPEAQITADAL